jgi:hypothetical protein
VTAKSEAADGNGGCQQTHFKLWSEGHLSNFSN